MEKCNKKSLIKELVNSLKIPLQSRNTNIYQFYVKITTITLQMRQRVKEHLFQLVTTS